MKTPSAKILEQILAGLEQLILPELQTQTARDFMDLVSRLLRHLQLREEHAAALEAVRGTSQERLLAELRRHAAPATPQGAIAAELESSLRELIETGAGQAAGKTNWHEPLMKLVEIESDFVRPLDPEASGSIASAYAGGRLEREQNKARGADSTAQFDAPTLQSYLQKLRPQWRTARVQSVEILTGGFNKETLKFSATGIGFDGQALVIRRDLPSAATDTSVVDEFPLLNMAYAAGMVVPQPLWLESDRTVIGNPFMVVRAVRGTTDTAAWRTERNHCERFIADLAKQMALLHTLPVPGHGSSSSATERLIAQEIDKWHDLYLRRRSEAVPLLGAEYAWLMKHIPQSGASPVLVHADIGFHNMLTVNGEITALLDWEFAHFGDPQEDLHYVRPFVEPLGLWNKFLDLYKANGGVAIREEDGRFWEAWRSFRNGAGCVGALQAFLSGEYANPDAALKLAVAGVNFGPRYRIEAGRVICGTMGDYR